MLRPSACSLPRNFNTLKRENSLLLCQVASDLIAVHPTAVHVGMHILAAMAHCSSDVVNAKTAVKVRTCEVTECCGCSGARPPAQAIEVSICMHDSNMQVILCNKASGVSVVSTLIHYTSQRSVLPMLTSTRVALCVLQKDLCRLLGSSIHSCVCKHPLCCMPQLHKASAAAALWVA